MKIAHHSPVRIVAADPITDRYEAEVQQATRRAEREYQSAQERLRHAQARREKAAVQLAAARTRASRERHRRNLLRLESEVERRRNELIELARAMRSAPASSVHRGRRGTPPPVIAPGEVL